jgi:glycosyltransferase involved in cell wall biosynthesis
MEWFPHLPGGLNRYFHGLVQALPSVGVRGRAIVSYLDSPVSLGEGGFEVAAAATKNCSLLSTLRGARRSVRQTLRQGVDIVNSHFAMYAFPWVRLLPADVPLVVNFQGPWADEIGAELHGLRARVKPALARMLELSVYRRATRLITLSHAFARLLSSRYGIAPERIRVIPGALDLKPYFAAPDRAEARRRLDWPADRPILLSVRRLVRRMGLENLIDAIQRVRRERPDVLLLIGGRGPLADELHQRIRAAGLAANVRLLGLIPEDDLPTAYAAADLSLVPTVALEGFGLVTAESLGAGTPVLGTPVGATPEILIPLNPALVFDSPAADAIADRVTAALNGQIVLPSPQHCRAHAAQYDWAQVAPRVRDVFQEAINSPAGVPSRKGIFSVSRRPNISFATE